MKFTIKTDTLRTMVTRAMKGASCNKMIPITGMMCIKLKDNVLTLITTDATNYLYILQDKILGEDFEITVDADVFSKLIARLTCDEITLELEGSSLKIRGNGTYRVELPLDDEGELVRFPEPVIMPMELHDAGTINLSTVRLILATAKASLALTSDAGCYTGYYCGNRIITTDTSVMCGIDIKLWDELALVSSEMMDLLSVFTSEKISVLRGGNKILFESYDCRLFGTLMDSVGDYQIDAINGLLNQEYDSYCTLSRTALLQLLDRLVLFVSPYDMNCISLTFTVDGLVVESKRTNGVETLPYAGSDNFKPFTCNIDVELLKSQVKASTADLIELHYGLDTAIKFVDGNVTQVIALMEER